jgi:hypothetical protein
MARHRRPKDGVASLAYVPAIPIHKAISCEQYRDCRDKPGDDKCMRIVEQ